MARRGNAGATGSISARKVDGKVLPGVWVIGVTVGYEDTVGADGKPRRIQKRFRTTIRGTRRDAQAKLTEILAKQGRGVEPPTGRRMLGEWLEEYAKTWSGHLSPRTREQASLTLKRYLPGYVRGLQLTAIAPGALQRVYSELIEAGKSPVTVSLLHRILRSRLNKAVELGLLAANPVRLVKSPRVTRREYRVLAPAEARQFLALAEGTRFGPLWVLLLHAGLRPEEALGLKWPDLDGETLRVRRALVRTLGGKWELRETKTGPGRGVALTASALKALQRHKAKQNEFRVLLGEKYPRHDLIFTTEEGKPLDWRVVAQRYFKPLRERLALALDGQATEPPKQLGLTKAEYRAAWPPYRERIRAALTRTGLDRLRPYDLRHSAASLLLAADEHPRVVQEMLGHASITLTLGTYSHLVPGLQARAARRMESLLEEPTPAKGRVG